jgi:Cu2+-exporting ATPase
MLAAEIPLDGAIATDSLSAAGVITCAHCGLAVPPGLVSLSVARQFCCEGCRTAFAILHDYGLDQYYTLPQRRERPVRRTGRSFVEFDHERFTELYVSSLGNGLARVELYLEGVHCPSCVWLVERVPLLVRGVARAELDVRRALATIEWNPAVVPLSEVARTLDSLGYTAHPFRGVRRDALRRQEDRAALVRIGVAGAIAVNVMLPALALYSGIGTGMEPEYARFFRWVSLLLAIPALLGPGRVFFTGAIGALRARALHMDLPIAIALGAGFVRGAVNTVTDSGPIYFDGVTMLIFLLLCGRLLQQRGQRKAADAAELFYSLTPRTARLLEADLGTTRDVPVESLVPGQLIEVRPGDTLPADGAVDSGTSSIDRSLLTGESRPVAVQPGAPVFAGTLNLRASLRVRVTEAGESSRVARILAQVEESARRRAPIVLLADRLSGAFIAGVLLLAIGVYALWLRHDATRALDNAIALLIVTCPCALALATPLAVTSAIGQAARSGIFIKGGDVLEQLARPARLFLDKTGTITEARTALVAWNGPEWVKPLILALERDSMHPVAEGFRRAWGHRHERFKVVDTEHVLGAGIDGVVEGKRVVVGSPAFVRERARLPHDGAVPAPTAPELTPVWVAVDGTFVASAGLGDPIRSDAATAIGALRHQGWQVSILSGDDQRVVDSVARQLGLVGVSMVGGASPEEKLARVERARRSGAVVMVGDGVNDAAAIAAASVGIGVSGGAEACLATADVYLATPGLAPLVALTEGARRTMTIIRRNIAFSLGYNVVGATLAITGVISPLIAAVLMPASSLTVLLSSWRSRAFRGERP